MKRSNSVVLTMAMAFGLSALASWSAAGSIFSDVFTTDSSLAQPPWYDISSSSTATYALNPTAGQGLALTVSSGTGRDQEMFAQFTSTPVTLASVGDYLTLTVNFNSPSGMSTDTGGLLVGLFNTQGTPGNADEVNTTTGGATADDQGYFGLMGYNTGAGTSTKFYTRQGGAADANELGYYSKMTAGSYAQLSSFAASGNAILGLNTAYTLTYTIMNNGASGDAITAVITDGVNTLDSWVTTDTTGVGGAGRYNSFDELTFGNYGKAGPVDVNITSVSVAMTSVPEPSTFAFAALGLLGFIARFRRR
jgi:hypothetical protein